MGSRHTLLPAGPATTKIDYKRNAGVSPASSGSVPLPDR
jgi:hypothetical protein